MPYTAEISRTNPSCFLFLIDQSGSMQDPIPAGVGTDAPVSSTRSKAQGVADAINRLLQNLVIKCAKSEGVRDYYQVGVIGYGARVGPAFGGPLAGRDLIPISEIADSPERVEERTRKIDDGAGGVVDQTIKFPVWFDPVANGGTPMCEAMSQAKATLSNWIAQHGTSFPPIVINITDGESTDGDPSAVAQRLSGLATSDGQCLLFNIHVSSQTAQPIQFPSSEAGLPDQHAQLLYNISSPLPDFMQIFAREEHLPVSPGSRGFVFNADMVSVIRFLDIGTRPSNLR
jgi:hypothetical protein